MSYGMIVLTFSLVCTWFLVFFLYQQVQKAKKMLKWDEERWNSRAIGTIDMIEQGPDGIFVSGRIQDKEALNHLKGNPLDGLTVNAIVDPFRGLR